MTIISYNSIKEKIKKYSSSVDFNLERAGWITAFEDPDVLGRKSREVIKEYHQNIENPDDIVYCYRRVPSNNCGLPLLIVYVRIGEPYYKDDYLYKGNAR